jgi:hypothetical protein
MRMRACPTTAAEKLAVTPPIGAAMVPENVYATGDTGALIFMKGSAVDVLSHVLKKGTELFILRQARKPFSWATVGTKRNALRSAIGRERAINLPPNPT